MEEQEKSKHFTPSIEDINFVRQSTGQAESTVKKAFVDNPSLNKEGVVEFINSRKPVTKILVNYKLDKYFTPDISDIRVGYECEIELDSFEEALEDLSIVDKTATKWVKEKCASGRHLDFLTALRYDSRIRVPYLTKEQIEAEGWKSVNLSKGFAYRFGVPSFRFGFTKDNYILVLDTRKYHIEIMALDVLKIDFLPEFPETFRVTIPCKDINTFRYICKLLGI